MDRLLRCRFPDYRRHRHLPHRLPSRPNTPIFIPAYHLTGHGVGHIYWDGVKVTGTLTSENNLNYPFAFTVTNPGTTVEEPFSPWGFAAGPITYKDPDTGKFCNGISTDRAPLGHVRSGWRPGLGYGHREQRDLPHRDDGGGDCLAPFDH